MPKIFAGLSLARLPRGARGDGAMSETRYGAPSETPFLGGLQNTPGFVTNEDASRYRKNNGLFQGHNLYCHLYCSKNEKIHTFKGWKSPIFTSWIIIYSTSGITLFSTSGLNRLAAPEARFATRNQHLFILVMLTKELRKVLRELNKRHSISGAA